MLIKINCPICGKEFERPERKIKKDNNGGILNTCSRTCSNIQRYQNSDYKEKMNKILIENNKKIWNNPESKFKMEKHLKNMKRSHKEFCNICNEETTFLNGVGCMKCHNKSDKMRKSATKNMINVHKNFPDMAKEHGLKYGKDNLLLKEKFCNKCNKYTKHRGNKCTICYPESIGFLYQGVIKKYCPICNENTLHVGNRCYNCDPWNLIVYERDNSGRIIKVNGEDWENYIKNYIISNSINFNNENFHRIDFDESDIFTGYPSLAWKQRFTDICDELNQGDWIVYIKYYIDENNNSKPLVVGKTGNNNANKTGTDIVFNYIDKNQGPARQLLEENNLKWNTSFIDFKCFKTEDEAYEYEKFISNKYHLFNS